MLTNPGTIIAGKRYRISAPEGAAVSAGISPDGTVLHQLPPGSIVVAAEIDLDGDGEESVRISSPAGWVRANNLVLAAPVPQLKLDYETFLERHEASAPGDHYGLSFPVTLDALRAAGPEFLTAAFRAAGSISEDNSVTEIIELKPLGKIGASESAFLTVAYEKSEPGLHSKLFVKVPPENLASKYLQSGSSQSEVAMLRLSRQGTLPVTVSKYYFGDYSAYTTNYILITERIAFGLDPIEPAHHKGQDHQIPNVEGHYRLLATSLAHLAAAHKTGALGLNVETDFPFPRAARNFDPIVGAESKVDRLIDFIGRVAPQLFLPETTKPAFLARWREDLLFGLTHKDTVVDFLHQNVDYTALCHINLNVDNCWFWRDQSGALRVGLLDWGGVGQLSIAQALSSMLMMPDPDMYLDLERIVIETFVAEYARCGGPKLDPEELLFQYKASVFSTALGTIIDVIVDYLSMFSEAEYGTMKDRFDHRLQESKFCTAIIWIDNMLRDWTDTITPADACRQIVSGRRVFETIALPQGERV